MEVVSRLVPLVVDVALDCRELKDSPVAALFERKLKFETLFRAVADVDRLGDFGHSFHRMGVHERKSLGELQVESRERTVLKQSLFPQKSKKSRM